MASSAVAAWKQVTGRHEGRDSSGGYGYQAVNVSDDGSSRRGPRNHRVHASKSSDYPGFHIYTYVTFVFTLLTFIGLIVSGSLLLNQFSGDHHMTVSYWLEGDNSVNGDTMRHVNVALWAFCLSAGVLLISIVIFIFRICLAWNMSSHTANALAYIPIAFTDALQTVSLMQATGTSNLWAMVYSGLLSVTGDFLLVSLRVYWTDPDRGSKLGHRVGSSWLSVAIYVFGKLLPYCYMSAALAKYSQGTHITAAFCVYFAIMGLRVLVTAGVHLLAMMPCCRVEFHRYFVMQPRMEENSIEKFADNRDTRADAERTLYAHKTMLRVFIAISWVINIITFWLVLAQAVWGFGSGDNVGRKSYARNTWTISTGPDAEGIAVQFDRAVPVAMWAAPIQFGILMFTNFWSLFWINYTISRTKKAMDPGSDLAFGVGDLGGVFMLLQITGTTELSELLHAGFLCLLCTMTISEARKRYPGSYMVLGSLMFLVPFVHAAVNVSTMVTASSHQIIAVCVLFAGFGLRSFVFILLRYMRARVKGRPLDYCFDYKPHWAVATRYIINHLLRFAIVAVCFWTGALHRGWEVPTDK